MRFILLLITILLGGCGPDAEMLRIPNTCFINIDGVCHSIDEQPLTIDGVIEGNTVEGGEWENAIVITHGPPIEVNNDDPPVTNDPNP